VLAQVEKLLRRKSADSIMARRLERPPMSRPDICVQSASFLPSRKMTLANRSGSIYAITPNRLYLIAKKGILA
jgi:hypothetical protein